MGLVLCENSLKIASFSEVDTKQLLYMCVSVCVCVLYFPFAVNGKN